MCIKKIKNEVVIKTTKNKAMFDGLNFTLKTLHIVFIYLHRLDFETFIVGYHLPFQHNELGHLPYMAVALIPRASSSDQSGTDPAECVSAAGDFLRHQGAFPPGFYLLREGWVYRLALRRP